MLPSPSQNPYSSRNVSNFFLVSRRSSSISSSRQVVSSSDSTPAAAAADIRMLSSGADVSSCDAFTLAGGLGTEGPRFLVTESQARVADQLTPSLLAE